MVALSLDVWYHVLQSACTDGGKTGAALSRTSKAIRVNSAPYRFQSVQLNNLTQIEGFLKAFNAACTTSDPQANSPRVRHLLLAFLPGKTDMIGLGSCFHFLDFHSWQEAKNEWNARFVPLLMRLFEAVAPRLETLAVLSSYEIPLPYVRTPEGGFPVLRHLVLSSDDGLFFWRPAPGDNKYAPWMEPQDDGDRFYGAGTPPDAVALAANPPFPVLSQLGLFGVRLERHFALWPLAAPHVAYVRVAVAKEETYQVLRAVLLGNPRFSALRTVDVQSQGNVAERTPLAHLQEDAKLRPGLELTVLPPPSSEEFDMIRCAEDFTRE